MNSISSPSSATPVNAENSGLKAIAIANRLLNDDAQQIASPDTADVTAPLVDLNQALLLGKAGANLLSAENKMLGALFDAFA